MMLGNPDVHLLNYVYLASIYSYENGIGKMWGKNEYPSYYPSTHLWLHEIGLKKSLNHFFSLY